MNDSRDIINKGQSQPPDLVRLDRAINQNTE